MLLRGIRCSSGLLVTLVASARLWLDFSNKRGTAPIYDYCWYTRGRTSRTLVFLQFPQALHRVHSSTPGTRKPANIRSRQTTMRVLLFVSAESNLIASREGYSNGRRNVDAKHETEARTQQQRLRYVDCAHLDKSWPAVLGPIVKRQPLRHSYKRQRGV